MKIKKALVVDDSEINQLLLCKILETQGIKTDVAFTGLEAVEKMKASEIDLIFMDIQMPEMDGYEATGLIRQLEHGIQVKIIAVTAYAMPEDEAKCLQAGMDHYISKPVKPQVVIDLIERIFSREESGIKDSQEVQKAHIHRLYQKVYEDTDFFRELVDKFSNHYHEIIPEIKLAYQQGNLADLKTHVHTIKGLAAALEFVEAADILFQVEKEIQNQQLDNVLILLSQFEESVKQYLNEAEIFIQSKTRTA